MTIPTEDDRISPCKFKGFSEEIIKPSPKLTCICNAKIAGKFEGSCLKQETNFINQRNAVNLLIDYELDLWPRDLNKEFTLCDFLFGAVN